MIDLPRPHIGRRPLLFGAAGSALALAARVPVLAQPAAPPPAGPRGGAGPGGAGGQSAVIDVKPTAWLSVIGFGSATGS